MSLANNAMEQKEEAQQSDPEKITSTSIHSNSDENPPTHTLANDRARDSLSASSNPVLRAVLESRIALDSESEEDLPIISSLTFDEEDFDIVPIALDQDSGSGIAGFLIRASNGEAEYPEVDPLPTASDADAGDERLCQICYETLPGPSFPQRAPNSKCEHDANVCSTCLAKSLAQQMGQKMWDQIDCPVCSGRLGFFDVKEFADMLILLPLRSTSPEECCSAFTDSIIEYLLNL